MSASATTNQKIKKGASEKNLEKLKDCINNNQGQIDIDEIICEEASAVLKLLEELNLNLDDQFTSDKFKQRVNEFENIVRNLVIMVFLLGQWGNGKEFQRLINLINQLLRQSDQKSYKGGKVNWIHLNNYPLVLLITGYCLGLTYSKRWSEFYDIHSTFLTPVGETEPIRIVNYLTIYTWEGLAIPNWHELRKDINNSRFRLEIYVESLFKEWMSNGTKSITEFEDLFGQLGILTSIVCMEDLEIEYIQRTLIDKIIEFKYWLPVGKIIRDRKGKIAVRKNLFTERNMSKMVNAGFGELDKNKLELFRQYEEFYSDSIRLDGY